MLAKSKLALVSVGRLAGCALKRNWLKAGENASADGRRKSVHRLSDTACQTERRCPPTRRSLSPGRRNPNAVTFFLSSFPAPVIRGREAKMRLRTTRERLFGVAARLDFSFSLVCVSNKYPISVYPSSLPSSCIAWRSSICSLRRESERRTPNGRRKVLT